MNTGIPPAAPFCLLPPSPPIQKSRCIGRIWSAQGHLTGCKLHSIGSMQLPVLTQCALPWCETALWPFHDSIGSMQHTCLGPRALQDCALNLVPYCCFWLQYPGSSLPLFVMHNSFLHETIAGLGPTLSRVHIFLSVELNPFSIICSPPE